MVLSFSLPSKQLKVKDPLAQARSRLEDLDIKTVIPYISDKTTHVVQSKRNTAKGLQALVNGKHIVQDSYIENIVYAATPKDLDQEESLSLLEEDFDTAWPDATKYLPPRGSEPTELPDSAYEPNFDRSEVFKGYTFVFCESGRFEELQGPITNGHGKALLYEIEPGKTTAKEIADYMTTAAGRKGLAGDQDGTGGVLLTQFRVKGHDNWAVDIENRVMQLTGQKVVGPSEFLDAILRNNASQLFKSVPKESPAAAQEYIEEPSQIQEASVADTTIDVIVEDSQEIRPAKRARTGTYVPKFKAFDDGFDMESIPTYTFEEEGEPADDSQVCTYIDVQILMVLILTLGKSMVPSSVPEPVPSQAPLPDEEDDAVSELLPGATAMKRRLNGKKRPETPPPVEPPKKARRPKLDVMEAARQRREAEDEAAMVRRQEEAASFQAIAGGMDLSQLQNLAIVEQIEVQPRISQSHTTNNAWDERWNGRKNFKKFRRKGDRAAPNRVQAVIVPLEEVKKNDFGTTTVGFREARTRPSERNRSVSESNINTPLTSQDTAQSRAPSQTSRRQKRDRDSDSDDDGLRFRFRRKRQR